MRYTRCFPVNAPYSQLRISRFRNTTCGFEYYNFVQSARRFAVSKRPLLRYEDAKSYIVSFDGKRAILSPNVPDLIVILDVVCDDHENYTLVLLLKGNLLSDCYRHNHDPVLLSHHNAVDMKPELFLIPILSNRPALESMPEEVIFELKSSTFQVYHPYNAHFCS